MLYAPYWSGLRTFHGVLSIADRTNRSLTGTLQRLLGPVLRALGVGTPDQTAGTVVRYNRIASRRDGDLP